MSDRLASEPGVQLPWQPFPSYRGTIKYDIKEIENYDEITGKN